jgi:hypothetical protein
VQTFVGKAFEIDLDDDWSLVPDPRRDGDVGYFESKTLQAGLSCDSMVLEPHDRDLDELGIGLMEAYVGGLGHGYGMWSGMKGVTPGPARIFSVQPIPVPSGRQWIIAGALGDHRWFAWIVLRHFMYFTMRVESESVPDDQLYALFQKLGGQVFLGELVDPGPQS